MAQPPEGHWLLLMHQLPAEPAYRRVKIWRRLQRLKAVQIRSGVWALPAGDETLEDFHWLVREIEAEEGDAVLCRATFLVGPGSEALGRLAQARRAALEAQGSEAAPMSARAEADAFRDRVWVTRRGVKSDRVASAWLIRRWIDPEARFRFVDPETYRPDPGDIRFDMYEGEYTHEGDSCTLEVMASAFVPDDPALAAIAEMIHDIDMKEPRFGRHETDGLRAILVEGVCAAGVPDELRIERGSLVLDALHGALRSRAAEGAVE